MIAWVLIIDDDPDIRHNLAAYLEDEGMSVESVGSYEAAVELLDKGRMFDVCIMDARLPGLQGEAAIPLLKTRQPQLSFLVHTGAAEYRLSPRLRDLGMRESDVFIKPIGDMSWIADAIRGRVRQLRAIQNGR